MTNEEKEKLLSWFQQNKRPLPWRTTKDPYKIWISEVMLQQTTSQAVIPYYKRFIQKFPTLQHLAQAQEEDVLELWSGLGYYSRARNLHKAAKMIYKKKQFPKSFKELLQLPGFGPYTSRAVSSLAFKEAVGVLDGNVIRVLTRKENLKWSWWQTKEKKQLQNMADQAVSQVDSSVMNQALMELGATICLPQNPKCILCPWNSACKAFESQTQNQIPLKKPKKSMEHWSWNIHFIRKQQKILLVKDPSLPVLKSQWVLPGNFRKLKSPPKSYKIKHTITHHHIYIQKIDQKRTLGSSIQWEERKWVPLNRIKTKAPSSLIQKVLSQVFSVYVLVFLLSCQHTPKPSAPNPLLFAKQLTFGGENTHPQPLGDFLHIAYISSKRKQHNNKQIYILNRKSLEEKRLTFQHGDILSLSAYKNFLAYASTTDEDKERLFEKKSGSEIYLSDLTGRHIKRLTFHKGYDSEVQLLAHSFLFVRGQENRNNIFIQPLKGKKAKQLTFSNTKKISPQLSPSHSYYAWAEQKEGFKEYDLVLSPFKPFKPKDLFTSKSGLIFPSWHPRKDLLIFSAQIGDSQFMEIYTYNPQTRCLKQLTHSSIDKRRPVFSPEGDLIYFESLNPSQIFVMNYVPPSKCLSL
ncbi:MAG: hypothetical protein D6797_09195 [Bdellovibrio sp.]|nr:MAG: hypothetical protein D6797_09195 [Bdellovibrio sp.]